ncbi:agamous-like MADS-box protein AGL80 [Ziziphus jujuba]|uniref:Agamous-like MADS-box protein AGL80 n=2 Tax=Ziziphus jujuba TaxID=326968 RepID=A0ABM3IET9_ZIZJJ|nr:agamous-like MADS-box protein AGL80 [Ziziphus jujuba]KAH7537197.1 hypothetical protein FEM48_Zijuj03G0066700 [Ziziphus jujuba var. spinosa]
MTRKKVKLAYINNDSARKATFNKRKKGLMKKVSELSTLCDVDACAIVYSPYDTQPEIFPSPSGAQRVLAKFKKMPAMEQNKKMVNQDSFLRQRIAKADEQLRKQRKENREKEMTRVMFQGLTGQGGGLQGLSLVDLKDVGWLIDRNLREIDRRIEILKRETQKQVKVESKANNNNSIEADEHINNAETIDVERSSDAAAAAFDMNNMETMHKQPWFMDLMNPVQDQQIGFGGDEIMMNILPFGDHNHNSLGSYPFFP